MCNLPTFDMRLFAGNRKLIAAAALLAAAEELWGDSSRGVEGGMAVRGPRRLVQALQMLPACVPSQIATSHQGLRRSPLRSLSCINGHVHIVSLLYALDLAKGRSGHRSQDWSQSQ